MKKVSNQKPKKIKYSKYQSNHVLVGIFCLGFLICIVFFKTLTNSRQNEARASLNTEQMILLDVPTRPVLKGEQLKNITFTQVKWPASSDISKYLVDKNAYLKYYTGTSLPAFVPIPLNSLLTSTLDVNAVVENIPQGFRAITVKVDIESIVEGWAQTGNFVDVIVLRQSSDPDLGIEAKLIAENVKILAAGASVESNSNNLNSAQAPATVTLLVSQEDALKIRTAATVGKLTFALRGLGDQSPSTSIAMNQKTLLGTSKANFAKKGEFKGMAKGPDGQTYVLDGNSEWVGQNKNND